MLPQQCLDLTRLDPEPPDLELEVLPADELDLAALHPAHAVACLVEALVLAGIGERIPHESLGGQLGAVEVSTGEARATDVKLTGHSGRGRPHPAVQDEQSRAGHRLADRHHRKAERLRALAPVEAAVHSRLRRPVYVVEPGRRQGGELIGERRRHRFARDVHVLERLEAPGPGSRGGFEEHAEERRDEADRVHILVIYRPQYVFDLHVSPRLREQQARAGAQRPEDLSDRDVESERGELHDGLARRERVLPHHPVDEVDRRAVFDRHALRNAGRA